jgi:NAD-dependent SIR2 family protein deacetylase
MVHRDEFAAEDKLREYLADQLLAGRLALILGAGVSVPFGLPQWPALVTSLYATKSAAPPANQSVERQAEVFRLTHFQNDRPGFLAAVRAAMYSGADTSFAALRKNETLAAIASLVMASHRGSASEVITFNFDDLLEVYLRYNGLIATSISTATDWSGYSDVTVYHLHGLLPSDRALTTSENIIFDQQSFSAMIGDDKNPWRQLVMSILRRKTCLFIGLSGHDNHLDSLLLAANDQHACRQASTTFWGVTFSTNSDSAPQMIWESRGVFYKVISDYDAALPNFLFSICQEAAKRRQPA